MPEYFEAWTWVDATQPLSACFLSGALGAAMGWDTDYPLIRRGRTIGSEYLQFLTIVCITIEAEVSGSRDYC